MKYITISIGIILLTIISCTERINIELGDNYARLVVDGAITTDTLSHTVLLSKSSDYYFNKPSIKVSGASVNITDGISTYVLTEKSPGVYITASSVFGTVGKTYTLNIRLAEQIGGFADYSATSTLNPVNKLDSIGLVFNTGWSSSGIWEVKCYAQDPPSTDFYRFMISKNDALVTDTLSEWIVTDDKFFNGNYINGVTVAYLEQDYPDEKLKAGDKITLEMNSIGKDYATFLQSAQSELFGSNPLFSGPPANVTGNINNCAIGFFSAYSVSRCSKITPNF